MSQINAVGGTGAAARTASNQFSDLSSAEFVQIMITELTNQDPLKPNDSNQLLEQLSSLRNIESQTDLQDQLKDLVSQNQIASAGNLIGKEVEGLDQANNAISGVVTSVLVAEGKAELMLDNGEKLPMDRLRFITGNEATTETGTTTPLG